MVIWTSPKLKTSSRYTVKKMKSNPLAGKNIHAYTYIWQRNHNQNIQRTLIIQQWECEQPIKNGKRS